MTKKQTKADKPKKKHGPRPQPKSENADLTKLTLKKEWQDKFVFALRETPNVTAAATLAGISRQYAYEVRDEDEAFAAAWDDALAQSVDRAEGELFRRAIDGVAEPVFYEGEEVGLIQKYSDTLLIFLLKCHRRERYGERNEQFNIDVGMLSDEALEKLAKGESLYSILANTRSGRKGTAKKTSGATTHK